MSYIKTVVPMKGHRLFMEMESGSSVTVDLSCKLNTIKYAELGDEDFFKTAKTDGDYVVWGGGQSRIGRRSYDLELLHFQFAVRCDQCAGGRDADDQRRGGCGRRQ